MGLSSRVWVVGGMAAALACSDTIFVSSETTSGATTQPTSSPLGNVFDGEAIQASAAPRPMSGGTLITVALLNSVPLAVASDPDDDAVDVVTLGTSPSLLGQVLLQPGDEPGRLVADAAGRVHVILRGGGAVATIYPTGPSLLERRAVCSAPRGIDYDAGSDSIVVVCATGELMMFPAGGGDATLNVMLDRDLRDVVVDGDTLCVTHFRTAEVLTLDMGGHILSTATPNVPSGSSPDAAWRAVHDPNGGVRLLHQIASTATIVIDAVPTHVSTTDPPPPPPYGSSPQTDPQQQQQPTLPIVSAAVTTLNLFDPNSAVSLMGNPVIDLAVSPDGMFEALDLLGAVEMGTQTNGVVATINAENGITTTNVPDEFVAIADARASSGAIVLQRRSAVPALIVIPVTPSTKHDPPPIPPVSNDIAQPATVLLPQRSSHVDTGFDLFHVPTTANIACMSCHPEGGDDGHTWMFDIKGEQQVRRTQSLRGGVIVGSAPYHWSGDIPDMQTISNEIFTHRMGGGSVLAAQTMLLTRFLNAIPRVPVYAGLDPSAVAQGGTIFYGSGRCSTCHAGPLGTSPVNQDVGKKDSIGVDVPMKIPMLLDVADRAPYLHDGCAATLLDRLTNAACAGTNHGNTSQLDATERQNLVQFLESL